MSINVVCRLTQLLLVLFIAQTTQKALAESISIPDERFTGEINYWFVGHLGQTDDEGRTLTWEATIEGDAKGKIKWWFVNPAPASTEKSSPSIWLITTRHRCVLGSHLACQQ